ncbi:hypothetical protein FHW92_004938 [Novosphingobium sp. SG707]|nr:hypothetical protein [Novosphingobium sp. SG707]
MRSKVLKFILCLATSIAELHSVFLRYLVHEHLKFGNFLRVLQTELHLPEWSFST